MSVYVVAQGTIENREMLDQYVSKVIPTITAGGGKILGFDEAPEVVEGEIQHSRTVILEFADRDAEIAANRGAGYATGAQTAYQQPAPAPPPAPSASEPDRIGQLKDLAQLKEQGILTEEEFAAKKKQLLGI